MSFLDRFWDLIAKTQVHGQLRIDLPIVLRIHAPVSRPHTGVLQAADCSAGGCAEEERCHTDTGVRINGGARSSVPCRGHGIVIREMSARVAAVVGIKLTPPVSNAKLPVVGSVSPGQGF